jgi:hypothetical protein
MRVSVNPGRLRALLAAGSLLAVLACATAAQAASVSEANGKLSYVAATGEANHLTIAAWGLGLKVTETGTKNGFPIALTVGYGCWRLSSSSASCPRTGAVVNLGDGDDVADLTDGVTDSLTCGAGSDSGNAETADSVAADCEAVSKPAAPVDPGTPLDPGTTVDPGTPVDPPIDPGVDPPVIDPAVIPPANAVPPTLPPQTVGISASGVATVLVVCPADSGGCRGIVAITIPASASRRLAKLTAARKAAALKVGSTRFKVAAGKSKGVPVRLSKRGRQRILRGRTRRARISVTTRAADGTTTVTTQDVTLRPRAKSKKKKHKAHK